MRTTLKLLLILLISAVPAMADTVPPCYNQQNVCPQIGPTWNIVASGTLSAGGPVESFSLDWTITFIDQFFTSGSPQFGFATGEVVTPLFTGTTTFSGILGNFTTAMSNATVTGDGYLGFFSPNAEIDMEGGSTIQLFLLLAQAKKTPKIDDVFIYSCTVASACNAFGLPVSNGAILCCGGPITQSAKKVGRGRSKNDPKNVPEPAVGILLGLGMIVLFAGRNRPLSTRRFCTLLHS